MLTGCSSRYTPSYTNLFSTYVSLSFACKKNGELLCDFFKEKLSLLSDLSDAYHVKNERNLAIVNNASYAVNVGETLSEMITLAKNYIDISDGYYNPLLKKVNDEWKTSISKNETPTEEKITELLAQVSNTQIEIDGTYVNLNGEAELDITPVARGYALDIIKDAFESNYVTSYIASIGSTSLVMSHSKNGGTFDIYIPDTVKGDYFKLKDCSVGIASDYYQSESASYPFVINPKDGTRNYNYDKVVVVGQDPVLCSVMANAGLFMNEEQLNSLCSSKNLEILAYKNQEVKYNTISAKLHHYLK